MSDYPANAAAFRYVLSTAVSTGARTIIEAGIGAGAAIDTWHSAGLDISGFDLNEDCVDQAQQRMLAAGLDPAAVSLADARDANSLTGVRYAGTADLCVAMGVAPHCEDTEQLVNTLLSLVRPGGTVFIEFRNALFSLFTFNRYTYDFMMDELFIDTTPNVRAQMSEALRRRLVMDVPARPAPQSQFHNPLTIREELAGTGARDVDVIPFHYHAAMPMTADLDRQGFQDASWELESRPADWRSLFLCSAFLVQATRGAKA
jgi:hypothetical protein